MKFLFSKNLYLMRLVSTKLNVENHLNIFTNFKNYD